MDGGLSVEDRAAGDSLRQGSEDAGGILTVEGAVTDGGRTMIGKVT